MIGAFFGFDKHIIDIDFHGLAHQWLKRLSFYLIGFAKGITFSL